VHRRIRVDEALSASVVIAREELAGPADPPDPPGPGPLGPATPLPLSTAKVASHERSVPDREMPVAPAQALRAARMRKPRRSQLDVDRERVVIVRRACVAARPAQEFRLVRHASDAAQRCGGHSWRGGGSSRLVPARPGSSRLVPEPPSRRPRSLTVDPLAGRRTSRSGAAREPGDKSAIRAGAGLAASVRPVIPPETQGRDRCNRPTGKEIGP
jgi:hypothetical protein